MDTNVSRSSQVSGLDVSQIRSLYQSAHSSRYKWKNRGALPPKLKVVGRMLAKLARRHREFPGVAVNEDRLNRQIASEIGEGVGAADDYVRALKNVAILIPVELPDGRELLLYNQEAMQKAVAFEEDLGPALNPPTDHEVETTVRALMSKPALTSELRDTEEQFKLGNGSSTEPDLDAVLLTLDEAKRTIQVMEGGGMLEDIVVNPLSVLQAAFPACKADRLQTFLTRAKGMQCLIPIGKDVYRFTLAPSPTSTSAPGSQTRDVDQAIDDEIGLLRAKLQQAQAELDKREQSLRERREAIEAEIKRGYDRTLAEQCDAIRARAEAAFQQRQREISQQLETNLVALQREFDERRAALQAAADEMLAVEQRQYTDEAESQISRVAEQAQQTLASDLSQRLQKQSVLEERDLEPWQSKLEDLRERLRLLEDYRSRRDRPLPTT